MKRHAIIVEPYASAAGYARAFRDRGVSPIALVATPQPLPIFLPVWHPEEFDEVVYHRGDFDDLLTELKAYNPVCVIPGLESGVELAERIGDLLTPGQGNRQGLGGARRDKWHMAQALERAGVPRLRQIATSVPADVEEWIRANDLADRRLVLKPPKSGGTDDVYSAEPGGWRPIFDRILGTVNRFDIVNDTVLVQEYAEGVEYIVDGYSVDGRYGLMGVWRYRKHSGGQHIGIYDSTEFVPEDDPVVAPLADYTHRVADAVGILNGSSHAEVMMTADGPRLIEIAARFDGSCMQVCQRLALGENQIDRTIRHRLDGEFISGYTLRQHVSAMWLSVPEPGRLPDLSPLGAIRALPTVKSFDLYHSAGTVLNSTYDLFSLLGVVVLAGPDKAAVDADHDRIQQFQQLIRMEAV